MPALAVPVRIRWAGLTARHPGLRAPPLPGWFTTARNGTVTMNLRLDEAEAASLRPASQDWLLGHRPSCEVRSRAALSLAGSQGR